jgi:flagellar hook-associated protein 2
MASSTSGASSNIVTFTGTSRYSQDFQNVINRSLAIAALPITLLNTQNATLNDQSSALTELQAKFNALSDAVDAITTATGTGSLATEVSDPSVASATVGEGAMEGVYSIEVTSLGAYTTSTSSDTGLAKVTDPTSQNLTNATTFTLTVGRSSGTITPTTNSLYGLANAINASGANVQATVVNLGSTADPDYRLSLKSTQLGEVAIQLSANTKDAEGNPVSTDMMVEQSAGSLATFKPNGSTEEISSASRDVTLGQGVRVTMKAASQAEQATTITVTRTSDALSSALQTFVSAYNAAADDLGQQRGLSAGALSGKSVVYQLRDALNQLSHYYAPGGAIGSLADLGVTFDQDASGHLSFDQGTFFANSFAHMPQIMSFLGDSTTGFLKAANSAIRFADNPTGGSLKTALDDVQGQITTNNSRITREQAKVDQLQTQLMSQMAAADALISSMEQQYTVISNLFLAMNQASTSNSNQNSLA